MRITSMGGGFQSRDWHDPRQSRRPASQPEAGGAGPPREAPVTVSQTAAEHVRAQVASLSQAIQWTESTLALVVAAEQGLASIAEALQRLRGRWDPVPASGPGPGRGPGQESDPAPREAWAAAVREELRRIDALAADTRFGQQGLLDGSLGCQAAAFGAALELVAVDGGVRSSPPDGFAVWLTQEPTRPTLLAEVPLTEALLAQPLELALEEGGRAVQVRTQAGEAPQAVVEALNGRLQAQGLPLRVERTGSGRLLVQHHQVGSGWAFSARSSVPGVLGDRQGRPVLVRNGRDVEGTLHGEPAFGQGNVLVGLPGNRCTAGLAVRYTGSPPLGPEPAGDGWKQGRLLAGRVLVVQRGLLLRLPGQEAQEAVLHLDAMGCEQLGRAGPGAVAGAASRAGSETPALAASSGNAGSATEAPGPPDSVPRSLADLADLAPERQGPGLAVRCAAVLGRAQEQVRENQERARQVRAGTLQPHLARLRVALQNLLAAAPEWAQDSGAELAVRKLSQRMRQEHSQALTAQYPPPAAAMLRLLGGRAREEGLQRP